MSELRRQPLIRVDDPGHPTAAAGRLLVRRRRPSGQGRSAPRLLGRSGRIWAGLVAVSILSLLLASTDCSAPASPSTARSPTR